MNINWYPADTDQYYKDVWMLHSLRSQIGDDDLFFNILRQFYNNHKYGNATTTDFVELINQKTKEDYTSFVDQYLRHKKIPRLLCKLKQQGDNLLVSYRWSNVADSFCMKALLGNRTSNQLLNVTTE